MDTPTQGTAGYYVWEVEGQPVAIHLHLEVVDRLGPEIMRGFGAVPKRGAEVGGVLLGTIEHGEQTIVRIEDFEPVACDYKRGPSYLLTEDDGAMFEDAWARWQPEGSEPAYAVGYYRSHTRDGLSLAPEDIDLLERYFPDPEHVALLVKPFATKVSTAGFFVRKDGTFPQATAQEFPLRRRELTGEEPPPRRPLTDRPRDRRPRAETVASVSEAEYDLGDSVPAQPAYPAAAPAKSLFRGGWVWIPLSFVFLLLGVLLGFQSAMTIGAKPSSTAATDFSLGLMVTRAEDNLTVKWNREAPPVRVAQKALLEIEDGGYAKPVTLDQANLQNGSIIYHNTGNTVRFRLIVYLNGRLTVAENIEWKQ
jgi:hypothetical protein